MSDITVNKKNLSRLTKRLQKSLNSHLKQDIPLHLASLIFAETFGTDSIHHFQQKIEINNKQDEKDESVLIKEFIENYFKLNPDTKIESFSLILDNSYLSFNLTAFKKNSNLIQSFGIFFSDNVFSYLDNEMKSLDLSDNDIDFMHQLSSKLHCDDEMKNSILKAKIKNLFQLKNLNSSYSFKNHNLIEISNYGLCDSLFALVEADFFDKNPKNFLPRRNEYFHINLNRVEHQIFNTIDSAFKNISKNKILLEFKKLVGHNDSTSCSDKCGICSYYLVSDDSKINAYCSNLKFQQEISSLKDFYVFLGTSYINNKTLFDISFLALNTPYVNEISKGIEIAKKSLNKNQIQHLK